MSKAKLKAGAVTGSVKFNITAYWGNDDAESVIKVSRRRWRALQDGMAYETSAWGWYEGRRFSVSWAFRDSRVTIDSADGGQCVVDLPVSELIVTTPE